MEYILETPSTNEELYLARGEECVDFTLRPLFTGDLLNLGDRMVTFVQHPCAMRTGHLLPSQLIAEVALHPTPNSWNGHFKKSFFPDIDGTDYGADFTRLSVLGSDAIQSAERVAMLSLKGVNLLVQRWIYHCSRVVIPSARISEQIGGPYEEADLVGDFSQDLVDLGHEPVEAQTQVDSWLDADERALRRQIESPQSRPHVRRELKRLVDGIRRSV